MLAPVSTSLPFRPPVAAAARVTAVVVLHVLVMAVWVVLATGARPDAAADWARLLLVVAPALAAAAVVGGLNAWLLRWMERGTVGWMAVFLAAASPFVGGVVSFLLLLLAIMFSVGAISSGHLIDTLFLLPLSVLGAPWSYLIGALTLGGATAVLMLPLARAPAGAR